MLVAPRKRRGRHLTQNVDTRQRLVQASAARLREMVLAQPDGAQLGSLPEVAALLGVGIVTVQQAARVLEHEGLLVVRRGPGGGYYGARPDAAALERSMATWLRVHGSHHDEALEMITLLETELIATAAGCDDQALREGLGEMATRIETCTTSESRVAFEQDLQGLLFRMVERPLVELLARVTMRHYASHPRPIIFAGAEGVAVWKAGRRRTIQAILARDAALARFEADRHRQETLDRLDRLDRLPAER